MKRVQAELAGGLSRPEVLAKLAMESPQDTAKIAYAIGSVPVEEKRRRYLRVNALLTILLICCSVMTLLARLPIDLSKPTFFLGIQFVVPLIGAYFTFHFHGGVYRPLALWFALDLMEAIMLVDTANVFAVLRIPLLLVVLGLVLMIALRVFPQLRFLGPRSDGKGSYVLE